MEFKTERSECGEAAVAEAIRRAVREEGYAVLRSMPFAHLGEAERDRALVRLAGRLGAIRPHADRDASPIWPVAPRPGATTISERDGECEVHTDSCYIERPERMVALYCVRPAADGGANVLVRSRDVLGRVARSRGGRDTLRVLGRACVPFASPQVFRHDLAVPEQVLAPIWNREGVRWRFEQVDEGFRQRPDLFHAWLWDAVLAFKAAVDATPPTEVSLAAGDLLVLSNCKILHGRKHFADPLRLLLRIRLDPEDSP